jgi:hypothetical protein
MPPRRQAPTEPTESCCATPAATTASSFTTPEASDAECDNPPAVIVSPIRRQQRNAAPTIRSKSDADVWELTDEDIIGQLSH